MGLCREGGITQLHSQLYLSGRVAASPDLSKTKKGKPMVRLLLVTELVRCTTPGSCQSESVTLPVNFFSREAEEVRDAQPGDHLVIGAHLYGTRFEASDGGVKHGVQIIADTILQGVNHQKEAFR
jgi:single-stranded DNA-binding protein